MADTTILLVDDTLAVRGLARRVLEGEGFTVLEASSAEEALALAEDREQPIDLLLTDYRLPEMRGPELARRLCADRPEVITVFMSGYGEEALEGEELVAGSTFIQKPFSPVELGMHVRMLLGVHD
jgi:two-component system cell cycle sensor histidine kinase/response regulator CckA